jgi:hypothetical protein
MEFSLVINREHGVLASDIRQALDGAGGWVGKLSSDDERKIERFRGYAEELRVLANKMVSPDAKALMLRVVADYERMANTLEKFAKRS